MNYLSAWSTANITNFFVLKQDYNYFQRESIYHSTIYLDNVLINSGVSACLFIVISSMNPSVLFYGPFNNTELHTLKLYDFSCS